jgi:DNA-binding MarR family transcriptional regulator
VIPNLPIQGLGMSELAGRLRLTLQRTGQLVQQLEDDGYLKRLPDDRDGRAKRVVYSKRGLRLVQDIDKLMEEVTREFVSILGARRFERLCEDLAELDEAVRGSDPALRIVVT